jgi:predicted anti-sigma-YlaC factor YlaD
MKSKKHQNVYEQICDFMGEDLDAPACKEVADHLESCPKCKVYFDQVKKTVTLCRDIEKEKQVPVDVKDRLFKVLNLTDLGS